MTKLGLFYVGLAFALFACTPKEKDKEKEKPKSFATDTLPVDAIERSGAICDRLVKAGVAKNCVHAQEAPPSKLRGRVMHTSTFEPVGGFPHDQCAVRVYVDVPTFEGMLRDFKATDTPDDDYPEGMVVSTEAAMWHSIVGCNVDAKDTPWSLCRAKHPVATCMKQAPGFYAKYKAMHDAAVKIVDGRQ